ncbi:hypothetical protein A3709_18735 [Halioglobus sp. HI00S01]|uniref:dTMP kinase n=1 Tax=Halioglobus sp. HI00S01 TaxID=1822214 RepID=UPI0007C2827F|nr:dTMP kinase [Halioglobus sp. HI00S01]KZX57661.1 hypothetical protein A3709_18735 [Halioglobus sp. HI00S01]
MTGNESAAGKWIVITGIDGCGKGTLADSMVDVLSREGLSVIHTREPGGTEMAEEIRAALLAPRHEQVQPITELLLIFAARAQHYHNVIRPALDAGSVVICERWFESSFVYQHLCKGCDLDHLLALHDMAARSALPDKMVLLDIAPEIGLMRAGKRGALDRFEQESLDFHTKARNGFIRYASDPAHNCIVVDASQAKEAVLDDALSRVWS